MIAASFRGHARQGQIPRPRGRDAPQGPRAGHDLAGTDLHHPRRARRHPAFRDDAVDILGGRVEGPRLKGRILPGADWQIVRPDGVTDLEARYAIETDRGTRVLVRSDGLRHGPPEVIAALARGEAVEPSRYY